MTLQPEDKINLSKARISKAMDFLDDARLNLEKKRLMTSVNRSYYAVLHAVRALLILEGVDPRTHEGVITMLSLRFVKPGLLSTDAIKDFKILLSRRTDVDYGDFESIDLEDAEDSVKKADELIRTIDKLRVKISDDL
jgi:hypothetical protein